MSENTEHINNVINVDIDQEMKKSFMDYSMSVIVSRALPDVRDGFKPVHRRILYAMHEGNYTHDKPYKKCAATIGDVLGRYHPHGDAAVYDAIVRMAQDFSLRYPLVDGQGNFGSIDGDGAAAYRYTEARMSRLAGEMLTDIDKDTVDFIPNYNEEHLEPSVLPSRFPNLLCNGSTGIAVAMATNMPPHNIGEVIDGVVATIDNPDISIDELMEYIKGPDFPTYGSILGYKGIKDAYHTGKGHIIMRGNAVIEDMTESKQRIIINELPYQVNKARMVEKIGELVKDKRIDGITALRDESDRNGMKVVIELRRDANANVILNQLYKFTQLQETFNVINLALVDLKPRVLTLKQLIDCYLEHQKIVTIRRCQFDKKKAEERAHILEGLRIALDNIDEVISIIRSSYSDAKMRLMDRFTLSDIQAQAILDMRLARLQGLEREKIDEEYNELKKLIDYLNEVLASDALIMGIVKEDLLRIRERYADERRTKITFDDSDINIEDLIEDSNNVITLTHFGYIKRLATDTYKAQKRGGKGISGLSTREEDFAEHLLTANNLDHILFFTDQGRVFSIKSYEIPESSRTAKGTAIVNILNNNGEKITAMIAVRNFSDDLYLTMVTKCGIIKKVEISAFSRVNKSGLRAITLREGDSLLHVVLTDGNKEMIIGTSNGYAIRFCETQLRPMGRTSMGVKSVNLEDDDYVVGVDTIVDNCDLLVVSENGFGKRSDLELYRSQKRGGKGIKTYNITEKTGRLCGVKVVNDEMDIMFITQNGVIIRISAADISRVGRITSGVTLMRFDDNNKIVGIATVEANS